MVQIDQINSHLQRKRSISFFFKQLIGLTQHAIKPTYHCNYTLQLSYRLYHSTKAVVNRVINHLLLASDSEHFSFKSLRALLDPSAAF